MMREGNIRTFAIFPEESEFPGLLCPIHRRYSSSREDINMNFGFVVDNNSGVVFTPPIMTEICAACLFNEDVKLFK